MILCQNKNYTRPKLVSNFSNFFKDHIQYDDYALMYLCIQI